MDKHPDSSRPDSPASVESNSASHSQTATTDTPVGNPVSQKSIWREYAEAIVIAMLLAFTIRMFVVQAFKIPSGSMIPTLLIGDHILVNKLAYGLQWPQDCEFELSFPPMTCYSSELLIEFEKPKRGDVIVFRYPEDEHKDFIKRIIGLPGDTIKIRNKVVYVNGNPLDDKAYTQHLDPNIIDGHINPRDNFGPVTVPPDSYFVMGDNRDHSLDSRFWGFVRARKIKGRAFLIYWSWNGQGSWTEWVRWDRIGKVIR
ncbi:MAG: signal peptidase I [Nitrospirae bacterium]|nr:MAG: signal peptidase I [Nitrospirota bacterium]